MQTVPDALRQVRARCGRGSQAACYAALPYVALPYVVLPSVVLPCVAGQDAVQRVQQSSARALQNAALLPCGARRSAAQARPCVVLQNAGPVQPYAERVQQNAAPPLPDAALVLRPAGRVGP